MTGLSTTVAVLASTATSSSATGWKSAAWASTRQVTGWPGSRRSTVKVTAIEVSERTVYAATCAATAGREWNSAAQTSQEHGDRDADADERDQQRSGHPRARIAATQALGGIGHLPIVRAVWLRSAPIAH